MIVKTFQDEKYKTEFHTIRDDVPYEDGKYLCLNAEISTNEQGLIAEVFIKHSGCMDVKANFHACGIRELDEICEQIKKVDDLADDLILWT